MSENILTIDPTYQSDVLDKKFLVRETIANAYDAKARGEASETIIRFVKDHLEIISEGVKLPLSVLLMGSSGSRGREECIGTFGEGLPLSLKTAAVLGIDMVIYNRDEQWKPKVIFSEQWGGEVVSIETRKLRVPRTGFEIHIPMEEGEWGIVQGWFLSLDPNYDTTGNKVITVRDETFSRYSGQILLDPRYKGRLYNKGVFVRDFEDMQYGYNVSMKLNRDRSFVDTWELRYIIGRLLQRGFKDFPAKARFSFVRSMQQGNSFETENDSGFYTEHKEFSKLIADVFETDPDNKDRIPVTDNADAREFEALGKKTRVVSRAMAKVLEGKLGSLEKLKTELKKGVVKTYALDELTPEERGVYDKAITTVEKVIPVEKHLSIVDFADPKLHGTYSGDTGMICLSKKDLSSLQETIVTLIHEAAHGAGGDLTKNHEEAMSKLWGKLVVSLLG